MIVKLLPFFIKDKLIITEDIVNNSETLEVSEHLYELVQDTAEELIGNSYNGKIKNV